MVTYDFPGGVHPETKKYFHGDGRRGYIPDTEEGRQVLALLVKCFERRLTFTVGYSVVRGRDNCIVWNGVHHKTRTCGGSACYGYPDDTYLNRVKQEMALKGVVPEDGTISEEVKRVVKEISEVKIGFEDQQTITNDFSGFNLPGF